MRRRASFWLAVGGAAVLANFVMELAADKLPVDGLRHFVAYVHRGGKGN